MSTPEQRAALAAWDSAVLAGRHRPTADLDEEYENWFRALAVIAPNDWHRYTTPACVAYGN